MKSYSFPQYRKYTNGASYFRINSMEHFDEIKKMPSGFLPYSFRVKILPDRHYIQDMLDCRNNYWVEISQAEYDNVSELVR